MGEPEPVGTRIRARYYQPTGGLSIGERTFGSFVMALIVDLICVAILGALLYWIGALSWAMISWLLR